MRTMTPFIKMLFFLLALQANALVAAQETIFQVSDLMDLPTQLNPMGLASCSLEFQEKWILNEAKASISKEVDSYEISCKDSTEVPTLPEGKVRLKNLSYEFSFLDLMDLMDQRARKLQEALIALINHGHPIPEVYNPREQLLSVYFHEEWLIEADHQVFKKTVLGITPVIWQERQTADGEPILDRETGYPVYYKLKLDRINLRHP